MTLVFQGSLSWLPPRIAISHRKKRQSTPCPCWWMKCSDLRARNLLINSEGKQGARCRRTNRLDFPTNSTISDKFQSKDLRALLKICMQGLYGKLAIASVSSYSLLKLVQVNFVTKLINMGWILVSFKGSSLPFACVSSSLNKPKPLSLNVSLPSVQDIRWNCQRLLYLFNIQLERNVATFFIVLLAACLTFVLIGGFLFFKLRGNTRSLEDCFWEAWACIASSSTHLHEQIGLNVLLVLLLPSGAYYFTPVY